MRILYLVNTLVYGGAELQTLSLALGMKRRGHEVRLVSMRGCQAPDLAVRLEKAGIPWDDLRMPRGIPHPLGLARYVRTVKSFVPEVVHTNLTHSNILGRIGRIFAPKPRLVSTIHSTRDRQRWARAAYALTDRLCDLTTGPSRAVAQAYVGRGSVSPDKMMVVPNGIDCAALGAAVLDTAGMDTLVHGTAGLARGASIARRKIREQLGVDEKSFLWLAAGRLMPAKDYPTLISAFFQHRRKHPDSFLAIAGEGPLREDLDAQVRREFEESNPGGEANSNKKRPSPIRFLGLRQDLPSVMVASDAFALSSAWEGFGLVLAEALYLGLPAAATDSGGVGDIFAAAGGSAASGSAAGGNADPLLRLCPIKDAPALAASMDAIREALAAGVDAAATAGGSDCGSRGDPRKAGRSRGIEKTFGIESILDRWEKIYQSAPAMVY